jgi:hypothetical protein
MKERVNITTTATAEELYTAAEIACSIALRTLHSNTGLQMYLDLIRAYHNDRTARAAADVQTIIHTAEEQRNECRRMARAAAQIAERLTITDEERTAAEEEAAAWQSMANGYADEATDTAAALKGVTFSDRADMTQAAALAIVQTWTQPAEVTEERAAAYAAAIGKDADELTEEEAADLQTAANFRTAINAARMESTRLAHPDAMNSTTTRATKTTEEAAKEWAQTFGGTGKDYRRAANRKNTKATDCWDTMEYKDTKTAKGWYIVRHYKTIRPYDSYEAAQEASGNEPTADTIADNEAAAAMLAELVSRANLTAAERAALAYYCIDTAEAPTASQKQTAAEVTRAAEAARIDYLTHRAAAIAKLDKSRQSEAVKRARATAENKATAARWKAALTAAGYTNERSRQRGQAAIIAALQGAAEHAAVIWYTDTAEQSRPDMIAAMSRAAEDIQTAAVIRWHEWEVLEAAAPCVTGWRCRAVKSAAQSAEAIRAAKRRSRIDNTTAEARARAAAAAKAYADRQKAEAEAAEARAEAEAKTATREAAHRLHVDTLNTTFDLWQTWSEAQKAAHMAWLNTL